MFPFHKLANCSLKSHRFRHKSAATTFLSVPTSCFAYIPTDKQSLCPRKSAICCKDISLLNNRVAQAWRSEQGPLRTLLMPSRVNRDVTIPLTEPVFNLRWGGLSVTMR